MIWDYKALAKIDFRTIPILLLLMVISLLVISATTGGSSEFGEEVFFTPLTKGQLRWFAIGWGLYLFFAGLDYRHLKKWTWILYFGIVGMLGGLFLAPTIQNVHRWYKVPFVHLAFQPSEYAKLIVVMALSLYLEKKGRESTQKRATFKSLCIVFIPLFCSIWEGLKRGSSRSWVF